MTIEALVRKCPVVSRDATILDFLKMAEQLDFAIVVDERGKACGMVSEKDVLKLWRIQSIPGIETIIIDEVQKRDFGEKVSEIMTRDIVTLRPSSSLKDALGFFLAHDLKRVVVVGEECLARCSRRDSHHGCCC